jgi:hypothetical protein
MHMILRYPNGKRLDALVLSMGGDAMRIAVRGRNETMELEFVYDRWISEDGQRVSIEAILMGPQEAGRQTAIGAGGN